MEDKINPINALSVNFWVLRLTGAWIAGISGRKLRLMYNIYGTVLLSIMLLAYFSTEIIYMFVIWGDLESMSETALLLLTHVGSAAKLLNLLMRRKRLEKLAEDSSQEIFLPRNIWHSKILRSTINSSNRNNVIYNMLCILTVLIWAIIPLVDNSKTWFPFETKDSPIFEVIYAYQIIAVMMIACMTGMLDTFVSVLMALAGAQIDILRYDISNLTSLEESLKFDNQNVELKSNVVRDLELMRVNKVNRKQPKGVGTVTLGKEFPPIYKKEDDIFHERIVRCIKHHGAIIRFTREIQDAFGIGILVHFIVSSTILCLTCFELTLVSPTSLQFCSLILYQSCMLLELYCYCWYGNGLIVKTSNLMTTAFHSSWTSCSPRYKNSLRLMMCRMQEPMQLIIGGLFGLSLETFSTIIRTAYSIYAVIQTAHSEG